MPRRPLSLGACLVAGAAFAAGPPAAIEVSTEILREELAGRLVAEAEVVALRSADGGAARLSRRLRALAEEDLQGFVEEAMANLAAFEEFGGPGAARPPLDYRASHLVVWLEGRRLGVTHAMEGYAGGAHGWRMTEHSAWEIDGGLFRRLGLQDWFDAGPEALDDVEAALLDSLRLRRAAWVVDGSLTDFDEERLEACLPGPDGLRYDFNDYEVNPYSSGPTEIVLPWRVVEAWLPDSGLARTWFDAQARGAGR